MNGVLRVEPGGEPTSSLFAIANAGGFFRGIVAAPGSDAQLEQEPSFHGHEDDESRAGKDCGL